MKSKGTRIASLFVVMLVMSTFAVAPAMACAPEAPCNERGDSAAKEITGMERSENIAFALNLKEVRELSKAPSVEALRQIDDSAKIYSIEKEMDDGTIDHSTAAILPVETVAKNGNYTKITNVVAVWNNNFTRVMSTEHTFDNEQLNELTFNRVSDDGEIVSALIVSEGKVVENIDGEFFATEGDHPFWECVAGKIIGDCLCAVLGETCPPGTPSLCDFCVILLTPCYTAPNAITCGPAAACLTIELALVLAECEPYA